MCGRMNVIDDPNVQELMEELGMPLYPANPKDQDPELKPSQSTLAIIPQDNQLNAVQAQWGIKPNWSKSLLINAKSESISEKVTFKSAFKQQRALIPCQGWYEWKANGDQKRKDKYLIEHTHPHALLMAAVYYPNNNQFVTLTCEPNAHLASVHHRMPVIINPLNAKEWILGSRQMAESLFLSEQQNSYNAIKISLEAPNQSLF